MDTEFTKYLVSLGVGGILAALFYYQNRKDSATHADQVKELYNLEKGRTEILVSLVRDVTIAITQNTAITQSFQRRLDETSVENQK